MGIFNRVKKEDAVKSGCANAIAAQQEAVREFMELSARLYDDKSISGEEYRDRLKEGQEASEKKIHEAAKLFNEFCDNQKKAGERLVEIDRWAKGYAYQAAMCAYMYVITVSKKSPEEIYRRFYSLPIVQNRMVPIKKDRDGEKIVDDETLDYVIIGEDEGDGWLRDEIESVLKSDGSETAADWKDGFKFYKNAVYVSKELDPKNPDNAVLSEIDKPRAVIAKVQLEAMQLVKEMERFMKDI